MRVFELPEPRNDHVNVIELRPRIPRTRHRHPSLQPPDVPIFDQDDPDLFAASECVILTKIEVQSIAGVLRHARGHCPSPSALDEALALLALAGER